MDRICLSPVETVGEALDWVKEPGHSPNEPWESEDCAFAMKFCRLSDDCEPDTRRSNGLED